MVVRTVAQGLHFPARTSSANPARALTWALSDQQCEWRSSCSPASAAGMRYQEEGTARASGLPRPVMAGLDRAWTVPRGPAAKTPKAVTVRATAPGCRGCLRQSLPHDLRFGPHEAPCDRLTLTARISGARGPQLIRFDVRGEIRSMGGEQDNSRVGIRGQRLGGDSHQTGRRASPMTRARPASPEVAVVVARGYQGRWRERRETATPERVWSRRRCAELRERERSQLAGP
jgi:hypothetical protein